MTSKREDIFTPEQLADFDYEKEHAPKRRRWYSLRIGITKTERFEADPAAEVERVLRLMLSGDASGPAGSVPDHIRAQIAEHSTPLVEIDGRDIGGANYSWEIEALESVLADETADDEIDDDNDRDGDD